MRIINHNIFLGCSILENDQEQIKNIILEKNKNAKKCLLVLDEKVYQKNKKQIQLIKNLFSNFLVTDVTIEASEEKKNFETVQTILKILMNLHYTRSDLIVSIGGGVTSDIVGFVASIYKRGMKDIYIPSTTLSMIDASIGGKTGINFEGVKNGIGSFYLPSLTIMDLRLLDSLDKKELKTGLVEGIKIALTSNKHLFTLFEQLLENDNVELDNDLLEEIIKEAVETKLKIVNQDLRDETTREILNFGHTVAHAIELKTSYNHAECVAYGISQRIENEFLHQKVKKMFLVLGIDIEQMKESIHPLSENKEFLDYSNDKKRVGNKIEEIYLTDIEQIVKKQINF